jgi:hypothetical protein
VLAHRQAKVFFADESVIEASNRVLEGKHSSYRLKINKRVYLAVPYIEGGKLKLRTSKRWRLYAVTPQRIRGSESEHYTTIVDNDCGLAAIKVLGVIGTDQFKVKLAGPRVDFLRNSPCPAESTAHFLGQKVAGMRNAKRSTEELDFSPDGKHKERLAKYNRQNALAYGPAAAKDNHKVLAPLVKELGVNQFALAELGEAYGVFSVAEVERGKAFDHRRGTDVEAWNEHWGAVVARSGGDTITLENYTRVKEDAGADLTRYYFQMYGSSQNQTWHDQWRDDVANAISLVFTTP